MAATPQPGEPLTVIITGTLDPGAGDWPAGPKRIATIRRPDGTPAAMVVLPSRPGVVQVPGGIMPVILEALETAMRFWEPSDEIGSCLACGPADAPGALCSDHAANRVKSDRYRDVLKQMGGSE